MNDEFANRIGALGMEVSAWGVGLGSALSDIARELRGEPEIPRPQTWQSPVDDPMAWYCAVWHDESGQKNSLNGKPYPHTGIDLNLDRAPYGDVERGYPVESITDGQVVGVGRSPGWLGVVVVEHLWKGKSIWVRYAHLDNITVIDGTMVPAGKVLGVIGNWTGGDGGDHLHFDMCTRWFTWSLWKPRQGKALGFIDPVPVLRDTLGHDITEGLLRKGNG